MNILQSDTGEHALERRLWERLVHADEQVLKVAITGGRHVGKTTQAMAFHRFLSARGLVCAGFLERAVWDNAGVRLGYDYWAIHSGMIQPFARIAEHVSELNLTCAEQMRTFRPQGYVYAEDVWSWMASQCTQVQAGACWFWDELGILEARGEGIWPIFDQVVAQNHPRAHICVCRNEVFNMIELKLGGFDICFRV